MGSAALRDAIQGIIDWGETVGGVGGGLPRATDSFGSLTFNDEAQKARLSKPAYAALRQTIVHGEPLDPTVADHNRSFPTTRKDKTNGRSVRRPSQRS